MGFMNYRDIYPNILQCEDWVNEAGQFLLGVSRRAPSCKSSEEVENLVKEIETFRKEEGDKQDGRLKNMEVIITTLYGEKVF